MYEFHVNVLMTIAQSGQSTSYWPWHICYISLCTIIDRLVQAALKLNVGFEMKWVSKGRSVSSLISLLLIEDVLVFSCGTLRPPSNPSLGSYEAPWLGAKTTGLEVHAISVCVIETSNAFILHISETLSYCKYIYI